MTLSQEPASEVVSELATSPSHERITHISHTVDGAAVIAVFRNTELRAGETMHVIVTEDGDTITTSCQGNECSACEDNSDYTLESESLVGTVETKRAVANCGHANTASASSHLDSTGECDECGGWGIETNRTFHPCSPSPPFIEEYCSHCHTLRSA